MFPTGPEGRLRWLRRRPRSRAELWAEVSSDVAEVRYANARSLLALAVPLEKDWNDPDPRWLATPDEGGFAAGIASGGELRLVQRIGTAEVAENIGGGRWESQSTTELIVRLAKRRWEVVTVLGGGVVESVRWVECDAAGHPVTFADAACFDGREVVRCRMECEWQGDDPLVVRSTSLRPDGSEGESITRSAEYDGGGLLEVSLGWGSDDQAEKRITWHRCLHGNEPAPMSRHVAEKELVRSIVSAVEGVMADSIAAVIVDDGLHSESGPTYLLVERGLFGRTGRAPAEILSGLSMDLDAATALRGRLDESGLRAYRSLRNRLTVDEGFVLRGRLVKELKRQPWMRAALPVMVGSPGLRRTRDALGESYVTEMLDAIASLRGSADVLPRPPASNEDLLVLLGEWGLPEAVAETAAWGFALEALPVSPGNPGSLLGGAPRGYPAAQWPRNARGPLTHLATICLEELSTVPGRERLPASGCLSFFADVADTETLWNGPLTESSGLVAVRHWARPRHADSDAPTVEPAIELAALAVRARPVLTLPGSLPRLSATEQTVWSQIQTKLAEQTPGLAPPGHLVLGHPTDPVTRPDQFSLLRLATDGRLGGLAADLGTLTVVGDKNDVTTSRWSRLEFVGVPG